MAKKQELPWGWIIGGGVALVGGIFLLSRSSVSGTLRRVKGDENTSAAFKKKVIQIAGRLGMDPTHLMAVMSYETGGTFSPSARNAQSGATGLIQFMPSTARKLGTTTDELAMMSAEEQLAYVEDYLRPYAGKMTTVEDAYMAVLWPKGVGRGASHILFSQGSSPYRMNSYLDVDQDGNITAGEAASKVRGRIL
jgi:hypothetical protein